MKHLKPPSVEELKNQFKTARNVNVQHREGLSPIDRLALWITEHVGTMGFFLIIFLWTSIWLSWNTLAPANLKFDPFPAFVLWLFISNMIQIFLMPLIMIGQNLQSKHAELRSEEDYNINIKAEAEIETILMHLENQNEQILQILEKIKSIEGGKAVS
jgi:uncharacterized membrane protein